MLNKKQVNVQEILVFCEFYCNLLLLLGRSGTHDIYGSTDYKEMCKENLNLLLSEFNHEVIFFPEKEMVLVMENNPSAIAVAEIVGGDPL